MPTIVPKIYIQPREAFELVGQESFGPDWDSSCIDAPNSEMHCVTIQNLWRAFEGGKVTVFLTWGGNQTLRLKTEDAVGPLAHIDLKKNAYQNSWSQPNFFECEVNADELRSFIRSHGKGFSRVTTTVSGESRCKIWLKSLQPTEIRQRRKDGLASEAQKKFAISKRGFVRVWKEFTREHPEYRLPGRPPKSQQ